MASEADFVFFLCFKTEVANLGDLLRTGGRIVNMDAFLAFLDHVHTMLTTTYHNTPIMLMASPQWTRPDCEAIAQYIFEKTRTPALCLIHSAIATQYGLKFPHMTVIDIGFEKVDVTAIHDGRVVSHLDVGAPSTHRRISGGEVFTKKLMGLLEGKKFTHEMAEQLKKSAICEVLPYASGEDSLYELPVETAASTAPAPAAATAAAAAPTNAAPEDDATEPTFEAPAPPKLTQTNGENGENGENDNADNDGVLDVAAIVTTGQTKEFLAKKEKEKGKPGRKPKEPEAPAKTTRLPNSKRTHGTFAFEEVIQEEVAPEPKEKPVVAPATNGSGTDPAPTGDAMDTDTPNAAASATAPEAVAAASTDTTTTEEPSKPAATTDGESTEPKAEAVQTEEKPATQPEVKSEDQSESKQDGQLSAQPDAPAETKPEGQAEPPLEGQPAAAQAAEPAGQADAPAEAKPDESKPADTPELRAKRVKREIEVGLERFTFADREEIDRIVSAIYHAIQGIDDMYMRPACWDNLVFVGNGARLRGLKENILQTLNARHLVSPSTATIFTSELPSNVATPTGTGSQTPTGSFTGAPHQLPSSGVNPLLQAATTANSLGVGGNNTAVGTPQAGSETGGPTATHHFHSQTPTSIKLVSLPTYLQEWSKHGFEESMFLGAQVAARIVFCLHSNMDAQAVESQRLASLNRVDYK